MENVDKILKNNYLLISVIGQHAGEDENAIFVRKKEEIKNAGHSFWLIKSFKAKTEHIQALCNKASEESKEVYCVFVGASQPNGAEPTKSDSLASKFSIDKNNWESISKGIKVTGKIDNNATALVMDELEILMEDFNCDLWEYSDFNNMLPLRMSQGASTICCVKKENNGMKSRFRRVVAIGRLKAPYAVWLK